VRRPRRTTKWHRKSASGRSQPRRRPGPGTLRRRVRRRPRRQRWVLPPRRCLLRWTQRAVATPAADQPQDHPLPRQERALVLRRRLGTPPQHDSLLGMRQAPGFSPRAWRYAVLSPVPRARRLMMTVLASSAKFRGLDFLTGPNECALVRVTVVVASRRSGGGSTGWP